jgi:hypothetical protein
MATGDIEEKRDGDGRGKNGYTECVPGLQPSRALAGGPSVATCVHNGKLR